MSSLITAPLASSHDNGISKITCPECCTSKVVNVAKYRGNKRLIKAKCVCGCVFNVTLKDLRKFYRKKTNLLGSYSQTDVGKTGVMTVKDLSYGGLRFTTDKDHSIGVDDIVGVKFMLQDRKRTELRKTVTVKNVRGRTVGGEFCGSHGFDMDLCYYLMLS